VFALKIKTTSGTYIIELHNANQEYLKKIEQIYIYNIRNEGYDFPIRYYVVDSPIITIMVWSKNIFGDEGPCVTYLKWIEKKTQK